MAFSQELYEQAKAEVRAHRAAAEMEAEEKHKQYKQTHIEYARTITELSKTGVELARRIFLYGGGSADIGDIKKKNLALQKRAAELLARDGLDNSSFLPKYDCMLCGDTGMKNGSVCECVKTRMKKAAYQRLNRETPLELCSFDTFSLSVYPEEGTVKGTSPRRQMERVFDRCRRYAEEFDRGSQSLLMQGGVGLGKTHLSLAIAGRVIERGFNAVYGSAQDFLTKIEAEKFGRERSGTDTLSLLKECDLLILDDLGAEFSTPFNISVLYDLINNRLRTSSPTIISTNLSLDGLSRRYEERIVSRVTGEYSRIPFAGSDMRFILRKQQNGMQ